MKGVLQDTRCVARHPRSDPRTNCKIYDTGNLNNSVIPVSYQSTICQNLGTSSRTPVQTIDKTVNAVNRCEEEREYVRGLV